MSNKKSLSLVDMYKEYDDKKLLSYDDFRKILSEYNKEAINQIINGRVINLNCRLGFLFIKKIFRHETNKAVDWGKSYKKDDGTWHIEYFTDDYYCKFHWEKRRYYFNKGRPTNYISNNNYVFEIAKGQNDSPHNNRKKLSHHIRNNPLFHFKYFSNKKVIRIEKRTENNRLVGSYESLPELWKAYDYNNHQMKKLKASMINPNTTFDGYKWIPILN